MAIAKFICFTTKPRFQHDCNKCKFLGTIDQGMHGLYDMYSCEKEHEKEIVLRFGYREADYKSLPLEAITHILDGSPYKLAEKLDKRAGPSALYK